MSAVSNVDRRKRRAAEKRSRVGERRDFVRPCLSGRVGEGSVGAREKFALRPKILMGLMQRRAAFEQALDELLS